MQYVRLLAVIGLAVGLACGCSSRRYARSPAPAVEPIDVGVEVAVEPVAVVSEPVAAVDAEHPGRASVALSIKLPPSTRPLQAPRIRWATHGEESGEEWQLEAGETGTEIKDLPTGRVWVQVTVTDGDIDGYASSVWMELKGDHQTVLAINFDRGHVLVGRLVDKQGQPVVGRDVTFAEPIDDQIDEMSISTKTDKCGRFRFVGLSAVPGAVVIEIPPPKHVRKRYPAQVVVLPQFQALEDVVPGGKALRIVVDEWNDDNPLGHGFGIG